MISLIIWALLAYGTSSQHHGTSVILPTQVKGKILYPAAPLHYVNIGPQLEGDYKFGYDTGKGPSGQSFREEIRHVDGTVKGTYGVIDEKGHKRIVHYSSGKGGVPAAESEGRINSPLSSIELTPKSFMQPHFNKISQQFPVFKPTNYLQTRVAVPLYIGTAPERITEITSENKQPKLEENKTVAAKESSNRLFLEGEVVVPLYRHSELKKIPVPAVPFYESKPKEEHNANIQKLDESYDIKPKMKPRVHAKSQRTPTKPQTVDISYDRKFEDDYYDSSPAFIDIERLSYSIGSDRSSTSV